MRKALTLTMMVGYVSLPALTQQKEVVVDASMNLGVFKLLIGTNAGPVGVNSNEDYAQFFQDLGFKAIRTYDYYGPCD